ncbi:hypothetical protein EYB35_06330 [Bacillus paranthracis]|nr:hypothetical protein EYB35_06330 [Bacillus paranthracis]
MTFLHIFLQKVNIFRIFTLETFTKWTIWFKIRGNKKKPKLFFFGKTVTRRVAYADRRNWRYH